MVPFACPFATTGRGSDRLVQETGGDDAAEYRGYNPTGRNLAHLGPVGDIHPAGGDAGPEHAADDRVGGGNRGTQRRGQVQPECPGQQRSHHQPDEGFGIVDHGRVDDAFLDGADHVAARDEGPGSLENGGDQDGPAQRQCTLTHCRADVVGNVVGPDVPGHVETEYVTDDQDGVFRCHFSAVTQSIETVHA